MKDFWLLVAVSAWIVCGYAAIATILDLDPMEAKIAFVAVAIGWLIAYRLAFGRWP